MCPGAYQTYGEGWGWGPLDLLSSLPIPPSHWPNLPERSALLLSSWPSSTRPIWRSHFFTDNIPAECRGCFLRTKKKLNKYLSMFCLWRMHSASPFLNFSSFLVPASSFWLHSMFFCLISVALTLPRSPLLVFFLPWAYPRFKSLKSTCSRRRLFLTFIFQD